MFVFLASAVLASAVLLGACSRKANPPTPVPTPTPTPVASPTSTLVATPAATPTRTPGPTSTPVSTPALTQQVTPAATAAASQATAGVDRTPPKFVYIKIQNGFWDVPQILWESNEPVIGRIEWGPTFDSVSPWTEKLANADGIFMPNDLIVMNSYYVRVRVKDAAGNETLSKEMVIPYQELADVTYNYK
jgi:hypothetical protein